MWQRSQYCRRRQKAAIDEMESPLLSIADTIIGEELTLRRDETRRDETGSPVASELGSAPWGWRSLRSVRRGSVAVREQDFENY